MHIASFDIFDTALIRKCGKPESVFWIMSKKLFPENRTRQNEFVLWRETVSGKLIQKNRNYTLEELYSSANVEYVFGDEKFTGPDLCDLEYAIESAMLVANPSVARMIKSFRDSGYAIAFISDMYMSSSFLKSILVREGLFEEGDILYVSCECKARKDDGSLFKVVKDELKPLKWVHYGDNELSDFFIPQKLGIKSERVDFGYSRIERQFEQCSNGLDNVFDFELLIGYMRYLRLTSNNLPEDSFAIDFIAPLYYAYVKHVIDDATTKGFSTLYFLSRDSYIFLKIAEQIPHDGIDLRYLYVSRKSIQPAFRYISSDEEFKTSINGTVTCVNRKDSDKDDYELLDAYFEQEGLYNENIALVDLGWFGSTRLMVNKIRAYRNVNQCFCYYLGVIRNSLPEVYGKYDSFTYSERFANNRWNTFIIEEYFSLCPHPTTIGYNRENGQVIPVFDKESMIPKHLIETNIRNCCRFAQEMIQIDSSVLAFYGLNAIISMEFELERPFVNLLFDSCRNEEFLFRKLTVNDFCSYIKGHEITINDKIAFEASFGVGTKLLFRASRKLFFILRYLKNNFF